MTDTQSQNDKSAWLEATVRWYAAAMGLTAWRFTLSYGDEECDSVARTWMSDDYPNAKIQVKGESNHSPDWEWQHWPEEESVAHELAHVMMHELDNWIDDEIIPALPKPARKLANRRYAHYREVLAETMGRALVATAHADRDGEAPYIGGIVAKKETGQ